MTNIITSYMSTELIPAETKTNSASTLGYARQTVSFDEHTKNNTNAARASLPIYQQCQRTSRRVGASPGASWRRDAVYTSAPRTVSNPL